MEAATAEQPIALGTVAEPAPTRSAAPRDERSGDSPSLWEVLDWVVGLTITMFSLMVLSVPGIALFFILPAILVGLVTAALALVGAVVIGPPLLLVVFAVRRLRAR
jgi:hypothetical protein